MTSPALAPYVPRLVLEWQRDAPDDRYRSMDGTLVFADLSGFTAMSERLATLGRLGAEELTLHLDATFTALLDVAAARGGSLLKFGGDALLLFFWGDDHVRRGCAAAAEMRATLRKVGKRETSAGTVRLRMSIGVHSGPTDLFVVGGSRRQLVVAGAAASTVVAMEGVAEPGEIVVSPATAAALPRSAVGDVKAPGVLLARAPAPSAEATIEVTPAGPDPAPFVAPVLREFLDTAEPDGEHRWVGIAFAHLTGLDDLLARDGGEVAAQSLDAALQGFQAAVNANELWELDCDVYDGGPKFIVVAGAPRARENDADRLLHAMVAAGRTAPGPLVLRIGVNHGLAFTGPVGPAYRRTYTVMGDAVNTAARVMGHARAGQVLATPTMLDRAASHFSVTEQEPFAAKGKALPVRNFIVGEPVSGAVDARVAPSLALPLVGREPELHALAELVSRARTGSGGAIELAGDAGVGKTRLLDELAATAGIPVIRTSCLEYGRAMPYAAIRPLLTTALNVEGLPPSAARRRLLALDESVAPWLPLVGTALGIDLGRTNEVDQLDELFVAIRLGDVTRALLTAAIRVPTLWIVDDAHWLDAASGGLLRRVMADLATLPWAVAFTRRLPTAGGATSVVVDGSRTLAVGPLHADAALELTAVAAGYRLRPDQIESIAARSGGSPLFIRELTAVATSVTDRGASAVLGDLPDRVETLVASRVDRLAPEARQVLRTASVLGPAFDADIFERIVPGWRLPGVDEFLALDGATIRFRERLHQEAAYAGISFRTRRGLHRLVGDAMENATVAGSVLPPVELLSLHFSEAHEWDRAWTHSMAAAAHAKAQYANLDAAVFYRRAVEAAKHLPSIGMDELGEAWSDLANAYFYAMRWDEADEAARQARAALRQDPVQTARHYMVSSEVARKRYQFQAAARHAQRGLRRLDGLDTPAAAAWRARLLAQMGAGALESEHPRRAVELAQASLRSARDSGEDEPLGLAYYFLFASLVAADRADEALAMRDEGLAFLEHLGAMRQLAGFLNELGWLQEELGDWPSAAETYARVMDAAGRAGGTEQAILATFNLASLRLRQGRVSDAASGLRQALAVWRPAGYDIGVANALWAQADLAVTEGRFDLVEARALEAAELFEQLEQHEAYHATMTSLALGAAICGEPEGCFRVLHQIAGEGARVSPAAEVARRASRAAGIAHAALGDIDKALVEFRRAVAERSRRRKGREPIGEAAHDAFETALSLHAWAQLRDRLGEPPDFWRDRISAVFEQRDVVRLPSVAGGEPVAVRRAAAVGSS